LVYGSDLLNFSTLSGTLRLSTFHLNPLAILLDKMLLDTEFTKFFTEFTEFQLAGYQISVSPPAVGRPSENPQCTRMFATTKKFIENNVSLLSRWDTSYQCANNVLNKEVCRHRDKAGPGRFSRV
jgi:hypothetical protein